MPFSCKAKEMMDIQANQGTQCSIKGGAAGGRRSPLLIIFVPSVVCISIISLVLHENGMGV